MSNNLQLLTLNSCLINVSLYMLPARRWKVYCWVVGVALGSLLAGCQTLRFSGVFEELFFLKLVNHDYYYCVPAIFIFLLFSKQLFFLFFFSGDF